MHLNQHVIKVYVNRELYTLIQEEARVCNSSLGGVVRDGITHYFALKNELAGVFEQPGKLGEPHTDKIIHTLLARTEERLSLTLNQLENKLLGIAENQTTLIALIKNFYLDLMQLLPENPSELSTSAEALSKIRFHQWLVKSIQKSSSSN